MDTQTVNTGPVGSSANEPSQGAPTSFTLPPASVPSKIDLYYNQCVENWNYDKNFFSDGLDDLFYGASVEEQRATYEDQFPSRPERLSDEEVKELTDRLAAWVSSCVCPYCKTQGDWRKNECCKFCEKCKTYKSARLDDWCYDEEEGCDICGECDEEEEPEVFYNRRDDKMWAKFKSDPSRMVRWCGFHSKCLDDCECD